MKSIVKVIILVIGLIITFPSQAQTNSSFVKTFGTFQNDVPKGLIQGNNNDIIICGHKRNDLYSNSSQSTIYLLDSLGNLKENKIFNGLGFLYGITQIDSGYTFFGLEMNNSKAHESVILKTDYSLNFVDSFHVFLDTTSPNIAVRTIIDNDGHYLQSGYYFFGYPIPFLNKINNNGEIVNSRFGTYNGFFQGMNRRILEDFAGDGYFLFDQLDAGNSMIMHLDSNLNLDSSKSLEMPNITQDTHDAVKIGSDKIFYVSKGVDVGQFYAVCIDTANTLHYYKEIGHPQHRNYFLDGLSLHNNSLFIASNSLPDLSNLYFPKDTNRIKLIKMDTSLNIQWEKELGWDAYFTMSTVHATNDGGCLVSASVYDKDTMNQRHDIVLFKLDADGNVTNTHRIEDAAGQSLSVYPNPGDDYFSFNLPIGKATLQVFNQNGKLLFDQPLTGKGSQKIDMKQYASGVYFLRLIDEKQQIVGTAKWIKR